jgi:hypothetical protein
MGFFSDLKLISKNVAFLLFITKILSMFYRIFTSVEMQRDWFFQKTRFFGQNRWKTVTESLARLTSRAVRLVSFVTSYTSTTACAPLINTNSALIFLIQQ